MEISWEQHCPRAKCQMSEFNVKGERSTAESRATVNLSQIPCEMNCLGQIIVLCSQCFNQGNPRIHNLTWPWIHTMAARLQHLICHVCYTWHGKHDIHHDIRHIMQHDRHVTWQVCRLWLMFCVFCVLGELSDWPPLMLLRLRCYGYRDLLCWRRVSSSAWSLQWRCKLAESGNVK